MIKTATRFSIPPALRENTTSVTPKVKLIY